MAVAGPSGAAMRIHCKFNDLNVPQKRQGLWEWIRKQDQSICCLLLIYVFLYLKWVVSGWRKVLIKARNVIMYKEEH